MRPLNHGDAFGKAFAERRGERARLKALRRAIFHAEPSVLAFLMALDTWSRDPRALVLVVRGGVQWAAGRAWKALRSRTSAAQSINPITVHPGGVRRRPIRRYARLALIAFAVALLPFAGLTGLFAGQVYLGARSPMVDRVALRLSCMQAHEIHGVSEVQYLRVRRDDACAQFRKLPLSTTFADDTTRDRIATAFGHLEGRWRTGETFLGHDLAGPAKLAASLVLPIQRGGSGPILSAFESVAGNSAAILKNDKEAGFLALATQLLRAVREKWRYAVATSQFTQAHLANDDARAQFLAEGLAIVTRKAPELAGRAGARALLGSRVPTTVEDFCMIAASMGRPHRRGSTSDEVTRFWQPGANRLSYWDNQKQARILPCIHRSAATEADKAAARRAISDMAYPLVQPQKPVSKSARVVMRDALRAGNFRTATTLTPTFDLDGSAALDAKVTQELRQAGAHEGSRTTLAVAEILPEALALRAIVTSHHGDFIGPTDGSFLKGYRAAAPDRGAASVSKILIALAAAAEGLETWCDRATPGLRNPDGSTGVPTCTDATGMVPAAKALARSLNLPAYDTALSVADRLDALIGEIGAFRSPSSDPARGVVFGTGFTLAPARWLALVAAMSNAGTSPAVSVFAGQPLGQSIELARAGVDTVALRRAVDWLAAPLQPGGTLHNASTILAREVPSCRAAMGKSGTDASQGRVRQKLSVFSLRCGDRRFVAFASVGVGHTTGHVALTQIELAGALAPVLRRAIASTPTE